MELVIINLKKELEGYDNTKISYQTQIKENVNAIQRMTDKIIEIEDRQIQLTKAIETLENV